MMTPVEAPKNRHTGRAPLEERATMTVREAARYLGIGKNKAYEEVATGTIPSIRLGRQHVIPKVALDRMLENA